MMSLYLMNGILILLQLSQASGWQFYRIHSTKAVYESLTDKAEVNASVSKTRGLTVYLNFAEDIFELYTAVNLAVDLNDNNEYDFDVVKRTVNCCKLFKDPSYEPVVQFLYKLFLTNGNFPTDCPIKRGLYYIKDMKTDPRNLPKLMSDKKATLTIKHLTKQDTKMMLLAYYKIYFSVERVVDTTLIGNVTTKSGIRKTRPRN